MNLSHKLIIGISSAAVFFTSIAASASPVRIGVAWYGKSGMAEAVLAGVEERLSEASVDISLDINGTLEDVSALHEAATGFQTNGADGMIILRSGGSTYLAENEPTIPTFIGGNNHPVMLGAVDDMSAPSGNVTGVTYFIPLAAPLESFMALAPDVDSFLLVSQTDYPSSPIDGKGTMDACDELSIQCKQVFATGEAEVRDVIAEHLGEYDAVILGNQAAVFEHAQAALSAAEGKPVFSYAEKGVAGGALGGVIANDHKLGRMLADSLVDVVVNGKPIREVGIKTDPEPVLVVNMQTASKLGLELPLDMLMTAKVYE